MWLDDEVCSSLSRLLHDAHRAGQELGDAGDPETVRLLRAAEHLLKLQGHSYRSLSRDLHFQKSLRNHYEQAVRYGANPDPATCEKICEQMELLSSTDDEVVVKAAWVIFDDLCCEGDTFFLAIGAMSKDEQGADDDDPA
jgi:hypothetical protein